ncbi:MAG: membrane protein insertase YidC [Paludibacter sp.]
MDKNTIVGFLLIALIVIGFYQLNKPNEADQARIKHYNDSIALVEAKAQNIQKVATKDSSVVAKDSAKVISADAFGAFGIAANGTEKFYTLENELIKLTFSNKGGRIYSVQLKKYSKRDSLNKSLPLILFDKQESNFELTLVTNNNRVLNTSALYFEPVSGVTTDASGNQTFILRLKTSGSASLDYTYTLPKDNYMLSFGIKANGMNTVMPAGTNSLDLQWDSKIRQQERGRKFEDRYSSIEYKYVADEIEKLSESKDDEKKLTNKIKWIAYKDQFFSSILIADDAMSSTTLSSKMDGENTGFLKSYSSVTSIPFDPTGKTSTTFRWFFGPNQYKILSAYDKGVKPDDELHLRKLIPLGWGIFGWINQFVIIPMFNQLSKVFSNFGIIILIMTLIIKVVLFPLTYKSYISSAKMRVLKPEIDEINARIPADKAAERQKATMELYGKVGVSPLSGCVPSLLQMPLLFALFSFFPAAIELRQQSFLWATDLSAYDSIMNLPFTIPFGFGNHVSLFCLLMTVTNIVYTKVNMANTTTADQPGGAMMKWMMYLMPVMFLFMFNSYASGLSYYYFISTLISILQTYAIRAFVDEKKILAQLHAKRANNSKKPAKKSGFMARLEDMQRQQQKAVKGRK